MAGIDKIYGTTKQYAEFRAWLEKYNRKAIPYLYPKFDYEDNSERPISNFPEKIDKWLLKYCTIDWVVKKIKEQYNIKE